MRGLSLQLRPLSPARVPGPSGRPKTGLPRLPGRAALGAASRSHPAATVVVVGALLARRDPRARGGPSAKLTLGALVCCSPRPKRTLPLRALTWGRDGAENRVVGGRRFFAAFAVAVVCVVASLSAVAGADASAASVLRVDTDGVASAFFGTCDFFFPPAPLTCHETYVLLFREVRADSGGSVNSNDAPWKLFILDHTLTFLTGGPDDQPVESDVRLGVAEVTDVSFDLQHLEMASVAGAQVPMSDGSTFSFTGTWQRTSAILVYGNNGPENQDEGLPRHSVDVCTTANNNAHQRLAFASMTGTFNGSPVQSYRSFDFAAALAVAHYEYVKVTHGGGC